ncbi:MAG: hypothetical protein LBK42_04105 [Propionibacteriaceae bacterium]|nr:hypothetical protein [Propionibacteriaceae bacterium]
MQKFEGFTVIPQRIQRRRVGGGFTAVRAPGGFVHLHRDGLTLCRRIVGHGWIKLDAEVECKTCEKVQARARAAALDIDFPLAA